jgi:spermidine synthase
VQGALFAIFAASGFAGLIYESIWSHYLKLFLGHAAYAQTLVLAIFMGGMAVGSWISSRLSPRWRNLLAAYAITEAAIGLLALVFHQVFVASTGFAYDSILPRLGGFPGAVYAFKWGLSALLILPQSVLLGMTFPLMTAGVLRRFADRPGRSVALLYFTNSLGAAVGVLVSGFVLVPAAGLPGTLRIAGVINLLVAAAVWRLSPSPGPSAPTVAQEQGRQTDRTVVLLLFAALLTGATSFLYEVGWMRMLALVLGSSTHAFELMLSAFILGLALGGLWIQRRIDRFSQPLRMLGYLQLAMGVLAVGTLVAYARAFHVMQWLILHLQLSDLGYTLFNLASNGIALAIMLPATFCAGTTLPLITFYLIKRGHGEASVGQVYAANTVGAIAGVFFAVHVARSTRSWESSFSGWREALRSDVYLLQLVWPAHWRCPFRFSSCDWTRANWHRASIGTATSRPRPTRCSTTATERRRPSAFSPWVSRRCSRFAPMARPMPACRLGWMGARTR